MKENNLFKLWNEILFTKKSFTVRDKKGQKFKLKIIFPGYFSKNSGPDFKNAVILLNNKILKGDVEFHKNSLDWFRHQHNTDEKYNNVILHLVLEHNSKLRIVNNLNKRVNTFIISSDLKKFLNKKENNLNTYLKMPCFYLLKRECNQELILKKLKYLGLRNFCLKLKRIENYYKALKNRINLNEILNELLYLSIFRTIGYSKNTDELENFASQIEYKRFLSLQKSEILKLLDRMKIKKSHIRPCNLPSRRISQFYDFFTILKDSLFNYIFEAFKNSETFNNFLNALLKINKIGIERLKITIFNGILPVLYFYFKKTQNKNYKKKLCRWILTVNGFERNYILKEMLKFINLKREDLRVEIIQQGIIYLYKKYCVNKNCEQCPFYLELK